MDYLTSQIKFHEGLIQLHTTQLTYLKNLQLQQLQTETDELTTDDLPQENYLSNESMLENDQDIIWDRIRKAHPEMYGSDEAVCCGMPNEKTPEKPPEKTPEKTPVYKENNLTVPDVELNVEQNIKSDLKLPEPESNTSKDIPLVTRLSKFSQKKQNQILRNIFMTAKTNIEKLAEIDTSIAENIDERIQVEADRLLAVYLDNK